MNPLNLWFISGFSAVVWIFSFLAAYTVSNMYGERIRHLYRGGQISLFFALLAVSFVFYYTAALAGLSVFFAIVWVFQQADGPSVLSFFEVWGMLGKVLFLGLVYVAPIFATSQGTKAALFFLIRNQDKSIPELLGFQR